MVRNLVDIASKGGNYLLNVGPTAEGEFPAESIQRLKGIGEWMKVNGEAIYGTKGNPLKPVQWGRITRKQSTLYLAVFEWPANGKLELPGLKNKVKSISVLGTKNTLKSSTSGDILTIDLSGKPANDIATVIKVEVDGNL
jgi:alpha-L-fucosidase